jgi:hypothetical protein
LKKSNQKTSLTLGLGVTAPTPQAQIKKSLFASFSSEKEVLLKVY